MAQAALIVGSGLQAFAAIKEGQITEAQGKFAKEIAVRNQQALERQAKAEREAAGIEEERIARQEKIVKGRQRVTVGKSRIGLAGATLSALTETAFQFSLERNLALRRGLIRGRALQERGRIQLARGRWARTLGKQAKKLSYIKAFGSILGGAGAATMSQAPAAGRTTGGAAGGTTFGTKPAFTTGQRFSTFSGGGTVIPK